MNFVFKGFRLTAFNHLLLGTFWEKGQSSERLAIQTPSSVFKHDTKLQRFLAASLLRKNYLEILSLIRLRFLHGLKPKCILGLSSVFFKFQWLKQLQDLDLATNVATSADICRHLPRRKGFFNQQIWQAPQCHRPNKCATTPRLFFP